jgi:hypothetical protein
MPPIRQGLEKDAKEAVAVSLVEQDGLTEALAVLAAYVDEIYHKNGDDCPPGLAMTIDKLRDKLGLVEGHLKHYRALVDQEDYVAPALESRPAEPVESAANSEN